MKREHHYQQQSGPPSSSTMTGKSSMIFGEVEDDGDDGEVDELLAALGYKVRSSDMADVAHKLEQLDRAMGPTSSPPHHQDDAVILSHLASDTVHYNPSDLSSWLESMLSEINAPLPLPPLPTPPPADVSPRSDRDRKRIKTIADVTTTTTSSSSSSSFSLPLIVVDSQEAGIRLVHILIACAESVQRQNYRAADALVKKVAVLAASQGGAMRKVAGYFAEALARRIYKLPSQQDSHSLDAAFSDLLRVHFYESCPYLKFAHFTANQAILEAFSGFRRVHVIDFGMNQGMQWPALLQALAVRPEGPPSFRLTGIGRPQPDNTDALQEVGLKLAQLAETIHVDFEYRGFVANSLADLEPYLLQSNIKDEIEAVAVNSVLELHRLLAFPGAIEKVLGTVRAIRPKIVTVVEQEANHNAGPFADRFNEALHYYSTMFDSLEGGGGSSGVSQDNVMSEVYLGREICNVVACEGAERTERHETLVQWRKRLVRARFEPVPLGSNAFRQANMLLALSAVGNGYRVEENDGCLTLGWHTRPLIATSAWRMADSE